MAPPVNMRVFVHQVMLLLTYNIVPSHCSSLEIAVDGVAIVKQLLSLAELSDDPNPAVTRVLFTEHDMKARKFIKDLMQEAGLTIREDPMGNIFGRLPGTDAAGAVMTGSHTDAIPLAGAYDGTLGVIGGIAALAALKEAGFRPCRPLDVLMFTSEEPTRFGLSCIGSRALAGALSAADLDARKDENGTTFIEAATHAGYGGSDSQEALSRSKFAKHDVTYFVELHIEQGPVLEQENVQIGIVSAIAAPAALRVRFSGDGGHAGALLMPHRNDAGLAASELALAVEEAVLRTGAIDTVGTTGSFTIFPNAINSVPREAVLEIDVRDVDLSRRDKVLREIQGAARTISTRRNVKYSVEVVNQDPPATCGQQVQHSIASAAKKLGLTHKPLVSRAYHDSLFMAQLAPTGMIFIPCKGGFSHRPDEYASPADVEAGVRVLALTMAELSCHGLEGHTDEL